MNIVIIGLTLSSAWGNGHATTYRGLVKELTKRGHNVLFLEKDVPWYASNRDMPNPDFCNFKLYKSLEELKSFAKDVEKADLVIQGSYVQEGVPTAEWMQKTAKGVKAFYDIDTPVTLGKLERGDYEYLHPDQIPGFDLYLSFTGGPTLTFLERHYGSPKAKPLYCSVDPSLYYSMKIEKQWDLGYLGTYSKDRQPTVEALLLKSAQILPERKFIVAGAQYPEDHKWPNNVRHVSHVPPSEHKSFYNAQRYTLNVTRADMIKAGYSPSVRLFEAAACETPVISDYWDGLETLFKHGESILIARSSDETIRYLQDISEEERVSIGRKAKEIVLAHHTAAHRAIELEEYVRELIGTEV